MAFALFAPFITFRLAGQGRVKCPFCPHRRVGEMSVLCTIIVVFRMRERGQKNWTFSKINERIGSEPGNRLKIHARPRWANRTFGAIQLKGTMRAVRAESLRLGEDGKSGFIPPKAVNSDKLEFPLENDQM